jgi:hypothetical protein
MRGSVVVLSAEDGLALRPRLDAAGADVGRIHVMTALIDKDGARRTFDLAADLNALEQAIAAISDVRLVIVDPVTSYMGRIDSHRTTDVRRVLEPLADFAERRKLAVLAISHPPKSAPTRALYAVTGSYAYVAAARIVLMVGADPNDEERRLLPVKNNLAAPAGSLAFNVEAAPSVMGIVTSRVVWSADRVTVTADQCCGRCGKAGADEGRNGQNGPSKFSARCSPPARRPMPTWSAGPRYCTCSKTVSLCHNPSHSVRRARALGIQSVPAKGVKRAVGSGRYRSIRCPQIIRCPHSRRASDGAGASDKAAIATDNISMDRPTDTVEEEAWTV